jgi:aspartyl/asparaginyl beta-hydroxylase (cupin superfamily)
MGTRSEVTDTRQLVEQADQAALAGDIVRARNLLEDATRLGVIEPDVYLKLAGLHRAGGHPDKALASVRQALALTPRDFTALLMQASLLERLNDPGVGLAWDAAMAAKPDGELPPQIARVAEHAEKQWRQWLDERENALKKAMEASEDRANIDQRRRLARFRSNILHRTRVYHSEPTQFHYPELPEREFHPNSLFPWIEALEAATDDIAAELRMVLESERGELVPYVVYPEHLPLDQWRSLNKNLDWTAIHLLQNGARVERNAGLCPKTMEVLSQIDQPVIAGTSPNAMFSLLAPNTAIPAHVGVSNARLVCHLPLIVPEGCWFWVGGETRFWRKGEAFVFDDTIEHEALNPSDELRVVFIFDVWRPELEPVERAAVAAAIEADSPGAGAGL